MKQYLSFTFWVLCMCSALIPCSIAFAQVQKGLSDGQVPEAVLLEFKKTHKGVKANWQLVDEKYYVSRFTFQKEKYIFWYHSNGTLFQELRRLQLSDVPNSIRMQIYNRYPNVSELAFYSLDREGQLLIQADIAHILHNKIVWSKEEFPAPEDFLR